MRRKTAGPRRLLESVTEGQQAGLVERAAEEGEADGKAVAGEPGGHDEVGEAGEVRVPRRRGASPAGRRGGDVDAPGAAAATSDTRWPRGRRRP